LAIFLALARCWILFAAFQVFFNFIRRQALEPFAGRQAPQRSCGVTSL